MRRLLGGVLFVFLGGCGGSPGSGPEPLAPNPYARFGYTYRLYRGTFSGADALGGSVRVPITITTSEYGQTVQSYGLKVGEEASSVHLSRSPELGPFLASRLSGNLETLDAARSGSRIVLTGKGSDGLRLRAEGEIETPLFDFTNLPESGRYEGYLLGRNGGTGELTVTATVEGRVESDGSYDLVFHDAYGVGYSETGDSGLGRGRIVAGGTVEDPVLGLSNNVVVTNEVRAFGGTDDLTVAYLSSINQQEFFFRVHQVGQ